MTEEWREIKGHPGYEISDQGRVRSYRTAQGHPSATPRLLSPGIVKGYRQIKLGRSRQVKIHFLVLEAFSGPRPPGAQGRHRNGKPLDNRASNLVWGSAAENYADRHDHGTDNAGSRNGRAVLDEVTVRKIKTELLTGRSQKEIATDFGVHPARISSIRTGRTWTHVKEGS